MSSMKKVVILAVVATAGVISNAAANERHFTYAYESAVLAPGAREVELWTTLRTGRHDFYSAFENRAEFEVGLTNRLQTSFYLNWHSTAEEDTSVTPSVITKESSFDGISSEWKYKMSDPVADRIGSALYGEVSLGNEEIELETKLILDKRIGKNLFAYNLTGEFEWEREPDEIEYEKTVLENTLSFTHFFKPQFAGGLELESRTQDEPAHSALFLGPVVSYTTDQWWVAFTALTQLPAIQRSENDKDSSLVLDEQEKYNFRLLLSFRL